MDLGGYTELNSPEAVLASYAEHGRLFQVAIRGCDLSGINLARAELSSVVFEDVGLDGAFLQHATLTEVTLCRTSCALLELSGATLLAVDFTGNGLHPAMELREARLSGTTLSRCDLRGANLAGAVFRDASLTDTLLDDAVLRAARFENVTLHAVSLARANLLGAVLTHVQGTSVSLDSAVLEEAWLERCTLRGAVFTRARWARAAVVRCDFSHADVTGAELDGLHQEDTVW